MKFSTALSTPSRPTELPDKSKTRFQLKRSSYKPIVFVISVMLELGAIALVLSALYESAVLSFIGLGLIFWGTLFLFVRSPQKYVKRELMVSATLSSFRALGKLASSLGYGQKAIYLPMDGGDTGTLAFVPSEPIAKVPKAEELAEGTLINNPRGIVVLPPGLALADLIKARMGSSFRDMTLEDLTRRLPGLIVEDLEMARHFEMNVDGNEVRVRFAEPVYLELCGQLHGPPSISSSLGCPMCSAIACIIAEATRRPVEFQTEKLEDSGTAVESSFRLLNA